MRNGTAQGGYWYMNAVAASDLPSSARLVALVLCGIADNDTGKVTVSQSTIATRSGLTRRGVNKILPVLEAAGFIRRCPPPKWKAQQHHAMTDYVLVIPAGFSTQSSPTYGPAGLGNVVHQAREPRSLGLGNQSAKARERGSHRSKDLTAGGALRERSAPTAGNQTPRNSPDPSVGNGKHNHERKVEAAPPDHAFTEDPDAPGCVKCGLPRGNSRHYREEAA